MSTELPLFTYGSLMFQAVWKPIVPEARASMRARLPGFRRERVSKASYPGICADRQAHTEGRVYFGLSAEDLRRLDLFEGNDYARRRIELVIEGVPGSPIRLAAQAYVIRDPAGLSGEAWDPDTFGRDCADTFYEEHAPVGASHAAHGRSDD